MWRIRWHGKLWLGQMTRQWKRKEKFFLLLKIIILACSKTQSFINKLQKIPTDIFKHAERRKHFTQRETESAMAARKRAQTATATEQEKPKSQDPTTTATTTKTASTSTNSNEPPTAPLKSKTSFILKLSLLLLAPYFYLIFHHYNIDRDLKKSILINAVLSLIGFLVTVKIIPVASRYVLRRNLFGFDINKKGTPGGTLRVWVFFSSLLEAYLWFFVEFIIWVCVGFWF